MPTSSPPDRKKIKEDKMNAFSKKLWIPLTAVFAVFMVVFIVAYFVTSYFSVAINAALGTTNFRVIKDPDAQIFYEPLAMDNATLAEHEAQLCEDIEGEGAALLFNNDNALPLAQGTKFSCFSQSSVNLLYGGTGSGSVNADEATTLHAALTSRFGEGCINQDLWTFYVTSGYERVNAATTGGNQGQYRINEVPWSEYESAGVTSSFANYGDVALVVLARSGGEGADLPDDEACFTSNGATDYDSTDGDYLRLSQEETDMLDHIQQYKEDGVFEKIVVLLNSANSLQLDFLDDYDIDAALWIGDVGMTGINAVADILAGNINPSGRIVDTFLKDNHSSPAMVNFGAFPYANADELGLATGQNNTDAGVKKANRNYVIYQEGIYVGYRYYETRYEDYVFGNENAGDYDYAADVAYPFGYGLSYSTFEYSDFSVTESDDGKTFTVSVDVKNTGDADAKHTVQIYFSSPYTEDYDQRYGVEKASVELCGFDKQEIRAGATETYTVTVDKEDLTSYDSNHAKTYILDAGDYWFTAGRNAHDAVNNVIRAKAADRNISLDESRMYGFPGEGTGNAALAAKWNNPALDTETFSVSSATGNDITNRFDNADLNKYEGTADQTITYLTRSDWTGTFPTEVKSLSVNDAMWADGLTHDETGENGRAALVGRYKDAYWADATELPTQGAAGDLYAIDMRDKAYDDPQWEKLLDQMPYSEMASLVADGFHLTQPAPSINLPGTKDENGPQGLTASLLGGESAMAYTSEDVMAATFNRELVAEMGKCIGEDFQRASAEDDESKYTGIYGPGANIHRTPYSGRNFEYYSEDGWLSGEMCAVEVEAIQERGVYVFTKHFALNDQEEGRYGISTWSNEQAIREIYLEGFEGSVAGGGLGVMSSFNRLGVVWSGAHRGLMTGILRDEWGMKGAAITDCSVMADYMDMRLGVLAGQDLWDGYGSTMSAKLTDYANDPAIVSACRLAAKHIIYSVINSHAMNIGRAEIVPAMPWWQTAILSAMIVCIVLTVGSAAMLVVSFVKAKKK